MRSAIIAVAMATGLLSWGLTAPTAKAAGPAPLASGEALTPVDAAGQCLPNCRSGFMCIAGQCVSKCNPPCPAGQACSAAGECRSTSTFVPAARDDYKAPAGFKFQVQTGVTWGRLNGGALSLAGLVGSGGHFLRFGARVFGGLSFSGSTGWEVSGELGYFGMFRLGSSGVAFILDISGSAGKIETTDNGYDVPPYEYTKFGARVGLGLAFGRTGSRHGFIIYGGGFNQDHTNCCAQNRWNEDYSEPSGRGGLYYMGLF